MRSGGGSTRERVRERKIGTRIELLFTGVGATNLERLYKLGIYTPKLGLKPFRLITNMDCIRHLPLNLKRTLLKLLRKANSYFKSGTRDGLILK
jgi:hypothetical protein